jgi:hypothetical protein
MGGLAAGAAGATRRGRPGPTLVWLALGSAGLSVALAAGLARPSPAWTIPAMLVVAGLLGGATFTAAAQLLGTGQRTTAGLGLAADELGAAAGALLALVALLVVGMQATALGLAVLQLATLPALALRAR